MVRSLWPTSAWQTFWYLEESFTSWSFWMSFQFDWDEHSNWCFYKWEFRCEHVNIDVRHTNHPTMQIIMWTLAMQIIKIVWTNLTNNFPCTKMLLLLALSGSCLHTLACSFEWFLFLYLIIQLLSALHNSYMFFSFSLLLLG
jgi:hypothetical protein